MLLNPMQKQIEVTNSIFTNWFDQQRDKSSAFSKTPTSKKSGESRWIESTNIGKAPHGWNHADSKCLYHLESRWRNFYGFLVAHFFGGCAMFNAV